MSRWRGGHILAVLLLLVGLTAATPGLFPGTISRATGDDATFSVDYSLTTLGEGARNSVNAFLSRNLPYLPTRERDFVVTVQYGAAGGEHHIRLIPARVYESNWRSPLSDSDVISLVVREIDVGRWGTAIDPAYSSPSAAGQVSAAYSFPWTGGQTWLKTQGFHYSTLGYSLDFIPGGGANDHVLAIEAGTFAPMCYIPNDPYEAMVRVTHAGGDISGYLHLDKGSIPSELFDQAIAKGQFLGSLYTGTAFYLPHPDCTDLPNYKFATACGCGYGTHLHFEVNQLITIQGYSLQSISDAPTYTPYTSNNSSGGCCACGKLSLGKKEDVWTTAARDARSSAPVPGQVSSPAASHVPEPAVTPIPDASVSLSSLPTTTLATPPGKNQEPPAASVAVPATSARARVEPQRTPPGSDHYRIPRSVFGSGGGEKTSTSFVMNSTQGQGTDLSRRQSASYVLAPGYWGRWTPLIFDHTVYLPLVVRNH